ncbi:uncharacterized protein LOC132696186 isoform X2 [Cylas formicarius]|uniref:uncharacterized protein LOC132696186 isoform X2 n=1 Tax=Cylas formicarius TaxID=197179 RepID=UPI0029588C54|nr:uncharacterized protein LOC132696186 isoform X2 [Cylas formicarius]
MFRSRGGGVTMLHITEDTPPDMLAGAMDLTVHLPSGRSIKMSVERSTPMMDLLVQITTNNQLQLSNYTLQALGMAPSAQHSDKILPFKPNTPIGALDTQHVRVLPKGRSLPAPKYVAPGHQPFESTFRLKVHLPRNQLYVTRVSRNVLLEDIMKKVCEEKNLDPMKYEFKHPGNLDEVLDPKLTLSDYQITEIYVVHKGTTNLNQAFSAADIMSLRKEEERKHMHNKTGGGVFNLIFKRGKSSMGSGSVSSDNRSISPTQSDDSRSVTPPGVQPPPIITPPKKDPPPERPKPPQRKRRPAPKPPQIQSEGVKEVDAEKTPSVLSNDDLSTETATQSEGKKAISENGLTICHSRNSSDSSGYHEASILSEHCANTSLPRGRPKSALVQPLQGGSNLTSMAAHSRSTTSLIAGRKKKAAPLPPSVVVTPASSVLSAPSTEKPSPLVASQPNSTPNEEDFPEVLEPLTSTINPVPLPRRRSGNPPVPQPRHDIQSLSESRNEPVVYKEPKNNQNDLFNETIIEEIIREKLEMARETVTPESVSRDIEEPPIEDMLLSLEAVSPFSSLQELTNVPNEEFSKTTTSSANLVTKSDEPSHASMVELQKSVIQNIFASTDFLGESKPPEVVALIPKTPKDEKKFASKVDTFGKKQCFKIGSSILEHNFDPESTSLGSKKDTDSVSSKNSVSSALNAFHFVDEISDVDESMFTGSQSKAASKKRPEIFNQLFGMHAFEEIERPKLIKNLSVTSLSSVSSIPGFGGTNMTKWGNTEELNDVALSVFSVRNEWLAGDASDTESLTSNFTTQTPNDNLLPISPHSDTRNKFEEKSLDSTDSGIAQDSHSDREREVQDLPIDSPPKVFVPREQDSVPPTEEQSIGIDSVVNKEPSFNETVTSAKVQSSKDKQNNALSDDTTDKLVIATEIVAPVEPSLPTQVLSDIKVAPQPPKRQFADAKNSKLGKICTNQQNESELIDIDWHYQLPSPPKAFRDVSPLDPSAYEATSVGDLKDSVVTSPELFEKLKSLEDSHSENGTLKSEVTSIASEEPLNTLSLEHLEKRKSLVYNRELATSLKMTDSIGIKAETKASLGDTFSNSLSTFESTYDNMTNTSIVQEVSNKRSKSYAVSNTLPNFKITTYDVPKQKIKVFEDETIRSNSTTSNLKKSFGGSMQNISHSAKQNGDYVTKETSHEYIFYRPKPMNVPPNVSRSGSFSDNRLPMKPVSRSKSQLTLTKYKDVKSGPVRDESLSRSTSSFDISGLQSLEVMKLIQNKLDTPTGPVENLQPKEQPRRQITPQSILPESEIEDKEVVPKESNEDRLVSTRPIKKYHYRGPPAVELATWSERPKVPVAVKEDADYKLGNHFNNISSKLIVNTTNNNISSNNSIEIKGAPKSYGEYKESDAKFGGANEEITQKSGNVVIKIGGNQNSFTRNFDNPKLLGPTGYRKPFSNVNGNANGYTNKPRPHSIALDSNFDISRVPVVRSVEFKKPYKDIQGNNTSVTHIFSGNDSLYSYNNNINEPEQYRSAENIKNLEKGESETHRKIFRVGSYKPIENHAPPVVRGFRAQTNSDVSHRLSWNPSNYGTLPLKTKQEKEYSTNQHVPFSQLNLRRTESSRIINNDGINQTRIEDYEKTNSYTSLPSAFINRKVEVAPPPPPPQMPKLILRKTPPKEVRIHATVDPRDMLMESIRNFGGKKGLKLAKA